MTDERNAIRALQAVIGQLPPSAAADLKSVTAQARFWRTHYAQPTINQVSQTGKPVVSPDVLTGKADFDALRARIGTLQARHLGRRTQAVAALNDSAAVLDGVFIAVAVGLAAIVVLLALGLRATVIRPLHRLAAEARQVADGDFEHEVTLTGPREVTDLAADVNSMRERILQELAATGDANTVLHGRTPRSWSARTPSSSSSPTSPRTTCRSRCARWRASPSCCSAATPASWTTGPTSTSSSPSTAPSGCRR